MEVYFLDVGQGTCQVILLGDRRAIVIDSGPPNNRTALHFLKRMGVEHLERLIISHSHDDHIGGAVDILGAYQDRISKICCVQDGLFLKSAFWDRLSVLIKTKRLRGDQFVRLEVSDTPQMIWSDAKKSLRLRTYSPNAFQNLTAQQNRTPNPTSAVLLLNTRNKLIVFAADSEVSQWREIRERSGKRMSCDVLSVPHHAGRTHSTAAELNWLFDEALDVRVAVVSAGTSNTHGHPRSDVISALTSRGATVLCTQITHQCHAELETLRPGVLQPQNLIGRSSAAPDLTARGRSRNVACAGTVRVEASGLNLIVERLDEHQLAVDSLPRTDHNCPLCRS